MTRAVVRLCCGLILAAAPLAESSAQSATVYYNHRPGKGSVDGRVSYTESGDLASNRRLGVPPRLIVPKGSKACLLVDYANPLLYSYSLGTKPLTAEAVADLGKIVDALRAVIGIAKAPGIEAAIPTPTIYYGKVALLVELREQVEKERMASDTLPLETTKTRVAALHARADTVNREANEVFAGLTADDRTRNAAVILASQQQKALWEQIAGLRKEVQSAWEESGDPVCTTVTDKALAVTLVVKPRLDSTSGFRSQRPVGNVAAFEVTPSRSDFFEVGFGGLVSAFIDDQQQFGLKDGLVVQTRDRSPKFAPTFFASARASRSSWLWGTIGASADDKGLSAAFFGFATRFGVSIVGPEMTIGVGLSLARVTTGLTTGEVGSPLPQGVDKIDGILKRDLRAGLGVMFTLTGISPQKKGGGEEPKAGND